MKNVKNIIFCALVSLALPFVASAQGFGDGQTRVLVGIGFNKVSLSETFLMVAGNKATHSVSQKVDASKVIGFDIGVSYSFPVSEQLMVGVEAFFSSLGSFDRTVTVAKWTDLTAGEDGTTGGRNVAPADSKGKLSGFGAAVVAEMMASEMGTFMVYPYVKVGYQFTSVNLEALALAEVPAANSSGIKFTPTALTEEKGSKGGLLFGGGINFINDTGLIVGAEFSVVKVWLPKRATGSNTTVYGATPGTRIGENVTKMTVRFGYSF